MSFPNQPFHHSIHMKNCCKPEILNNLLKQILMKMTLPACAIHPQQPGSLRVSSTLTAASCSTAMHLGLPTQLPSPNQMYRCLLYRNFTSMPGEPLSPVPGSVRRK